MTTTARPHAPAPGVDAPGDARGGWRQLLVASSLGSIVAFLLTAAVLSDMEAAAYPVGFAAGLALLRWRRGRPGAFLLALLNLNVLVWMAAGALGNVRGGELRVSVVAPALLTGLALAGFLAAVAQLVRPGERGTGAARLAAAIAGVLAVGLAVAGLLAPRTGAALPADVVVVSDNVLFSDSRVQVRAGEVTLALHNEDLFWHTLTIDDLGIDVWAPVGGQRQMTFSATPGTYTFYCRIPGHESRMRGELVVQEP